MISSSIQQVVKELEYNRALYGAVMALPRYDYFRLPARAQRAHREAIARLEAEQKTLTQELERLQREENSDE